MAHQALITRAKRLLMTYWAGFLHGCMAWGAISAALEPRWPFERWIGIGVLIYVAFVVGSTLV